MILVSGASGQNGTEVVAALVERGVPVRAMVRSAARGHHLLHLGATAHGEDGQHHQGHGAHNQLVTLISGDFDDKASLVRALEGVSRAFLVTNSSQRAQEQQLAFIAAANEAGVEHIVKLSQFAADAASPVRFLRYHAVVEQALEASGLGFTILRSNFFMQGFMMFAQLIRAKNVFVAAAGEAAVSVLDVRDIAAAAAAALCDEGHAGLTYTLTGPAALTHAEMATVLSDVTGREINYVDIAPGQLRGALVGMGMDDWQADGLVEDYEHYRRGEASVVTTGVADATGRPPRSFRSFAEDYAEAFGG